jgi:hypothetical protein
MGEGARVRRPMDGTASFDRRCHKTKKTKKKIAVNNREP